MKKRIVVEKEKFDAVLKTLLETKPIARASIKTTGKHGPKTPLLAKS